MSKHFIYNEIEKFIFSHLSSDWQGRVLFIQFCLFALVIILLIAFMVSQVRKNIARQKAGEDITDPSLNNKKYLVDLPVFQKMNENYEKNLNVGDITHFSALANLFDDTMLGINTLSRQPDGERGEKGEYRPIVSETAFILRESYRDEYIPDGYKAPDKKLLVKIYEDYARVNNMTTDLLNKGRRLINEGVFRPTPEFTDRYYILLYEVYLNNYGRTQAELIKKNYESVSGRTLALGEDVGYNNTQTAGDKPRPSYGRKGSDPWSKTREKDPWE